MMFIKPQCIYTYLAFNVKLPSTGVFILYCDKCQVDRIKLHIYGIQGEGMRYIMGHSRTNSVIKIQI